MPNRKNLRAGGYTFCLFGFRPYDLREMAFAERREKCTLSRQ